MSIFTSKIIIPLLLLLILTSLLYYYFTSLILSLNQSVNPVPAVKPRVLDDTQIIINDDKYELVVIVVSYTLRIDRRNVIREFWANKTYTNHKKWRVIFVVGFVNKRSAMDDLYREASSKKDVLIVDVTESYDWGLPKKDMIGIEWSNRNLNFDYILKCDDDLFIDIDSLIDELNKIREKLLYLGFIMYGQPVQRSGRYGVSKEMHPGDIYEPYCSGGAFVLSKQLVIELIPHFKYENYLRIEDAHMGGRVGKVNGTKYVSHKGFLMWNDKCEYSKTLIASHPSPRECMLNLTKNVLKRKMNTTTNLLNLLN